MGDWGKFEGFVSSTKAHEGEGAFLRAVLALRKDDLELCMRYTSGCYRGFYCFPIVVVVVGLVDVVVANVAIYQQSPSPSTSSDPSFGLHSTVMAALTRRFVDEARQLLDNNFTTLIEESYEGSYSGMVMVQHLSELEEMVTVKK